MAYTDTLLEGGVCEPAEVARLSVRENRLWRGFRLQLWQCHPARESLDIIVAFGDIRVTAQRSVCEPLEHQLKAVVVRLQTPTATKPAHQQRE